MDILTLGPEAPHRVVLFATGAGGDPTRYRPLLERLADEGCRVVAPHFGQFRVPGRPSESELLARPRGLVEALATQADPGTEVVAIGHSIGAWAVLCLAGAVPQGPDDTPLRTVREPRIRRAVLYAPAAGRFAAPGALDALTIPLLVLAGGKDTVTPPEQALHLRTAPAEVEVRVLPDAGHFAFMHTPPPGITEAPPSDPAQLLTEITEATVRFVSGHPEAR
ncbi:alpha/beta fold hydrolase [Nocardia sp. NPDC050697]|uniref:alpha/beta hydrolase family protein n=1 Tax=Nocardia sp. NPDC050697 TaxID=3155158 RepID=UPI0033D45DFA